MGSYLGLPESLGGAKTKIFSFVKDRLDSRINGWSAKFLSKGGKEVMIKSVAAALPTYVMSCFRLPKTVTSKLTSAIAKYWWSNDGQSRGMHWMAWNKLCCSKYEGGLGFRNVDEFNTALLAKQLWRLVSVPDSLFAKVFRGRYFRKASPLDPIKSYSPSYGWRSMVSARPLVNKGLIKRVGSGTTISVWTDPWIPAQSPRPAISNGSVSDPLLKVENLIDFQTNSWNMETLRRYFVSEDIALISALPLGTLTKPDTLGWHYTKSGKYSVKSGYHTLRMHTHAENMCIQGPEIRTLKAHTWKIRGPPKLKHFMWKVLSGCIDVAANLKRRGINCESVCTRCGMAEESINHALFECPPALQTWALSQVPSASTVFPVSSVYTNMDYLFWRTPKDANVTMFPWILWYIWKSRNLKLYEDIDMDAREILHLAETEETTWTLAQQEFEGEGRGVVDRTTHRGLPHAPAQLGTYEFNCYIDGSWKATYIFAGFGWTCTNIHTGAQEQGAKNSRRSLTSLHAEVEALIWAMRCMIGQDKREVAFFTDCSDLVKMVSSPKEWPAFSVYLEDIESDKEEFDFFSLSLVFRQDNVKADNLARNVRVQSHLITLVNNIPPH